MSIYRVDYNLVVFSVAGNRHDIRAGSIVKVKVLKTDAYAKVSQASFVIFPDLGKEQGNVRLAALAASLEERPSRSKKARTWWEENATILVGNGEATHEIMRNTTELDLSMTLRFGKIAENSLMEIEARGAIAVPVASTPTPEDEEKRRQVAFFFGKRWTSGVR